MKTIIRLIVAGSVFLTTCLVFGTVKPRTYAVVGYYKGRAPSTELVDQAAKEIGKKMTGAIPQARPEDADQVVQILFERDGRYKIYWDSLPLERSNIANDLQRYAMDRTLAFEAQMENATGHGRGNR
jgi:hypothetical protein